MEIALTYIYGIGKTSAKEPLAATGVSPDLRATYPALAARQLGWYDAALLCGHEMEVPGSLGKCIRVLINWNTTRRIDEIIHVYLKEAKSLRPDRETIPESVEEQLEEAFREFEKHSMEFNPDGLRHEEIDD